VDSLKALDPYRPIREADILFDALDVGFQGNMLGRRFDVAF